MIWCFLAALNRGDTVVAASADRAWPGRRDGTVIVAWVVLLFYVLLLAGPMVGLILLTLGIRGRARFSSPTCAKCNYDLRAANFMVGTPGACPECGTDLAGPRAVSFGRYERSRKKIIAGIGLFLLPFLVIFGFILIRMTSMFGRVASGPSALPSQTTAQILAGLPAVAAQPWSWQELSTRLKAGRLSSAEVDAAMTVLTQSITAERAKNPSPQPLHWADDFVKDAIASGKVTPPQTQALCEAFFGNALHVETPKAVRLGQPIHVGINCRAPWDLGGKTMVWSPREVRTSRGQMVGLRKPGSAKDITLPAEELSQQRHDYLELDAQGFSETGNEELVVVFDAGAVDQNATLRGKDGKPGLKEQWPNPLATWQVTVRQKIRIVAENQLAVQLDTDPLHDPSRANAALVKEAIVRKTGSGVEVVVLWDWANAPRPPMSGKVTATVDDQSVDMGALVWGHLSGPNGNERSWGGEQCRSGARLARLSPQAKAISLKVTPDPTAAETMLGLDTIWGKPVEIKDIPLQRFDVETEAAK